MTSSTSPDGEPSPGRALAVVIILATVIGGLIVFTATRGGGEPSGTPSAQASTSSSVNTSASTSTPDGPHLHTASTPSTEPTSAEQAQLDEQLDGIEPIATRYETVQDALADGFVAGESEPNGTHLIQWSRMDGAFDALAPEMLLATGAGPDDRIISLVYYVIGPLDVPPDGLAGPDDAWHTHEGYCRIGDEAIGGADTCAAAGAPRIDGWMLHAWLIPDAENPDGTFAALNPEFPVGH